MKSVRIITQFVLTHNDGRKELFAPAVYELEDTIADHPYVRMHSDNPQNTPPPAGTVAAANFAAAQSARKRVLKAAIEEASQEELMEVQVAQTETVRRRVIANAAEPGFREPKPL
jgi:hypothetical protein